MDETIRRYGHLVTPPGERCQYSNLGYGLLDYVISRVSGQSYADYMRTQVFVPMGLLRASVDVAPGLESFPGGALWRGRCISLLRFRPSGRIGRLLQRTRPGAVLGCSI